MARREDGELGGGWLVAQDSQRARVHAAWVSGPLAVLLGVGAHVLAGEAVPGPWLLLAISALLSMAASMLARFRVPVWALFVVSGVVQQGLHLMFSGLSGNVGNPSSGHSHGVPSALPPQPAPDAGSHSAVELMLDAHVAVALLTVLAITQSAVLAKRLSRLREARMGRR